MCLDLSFSKDVLKSLNLSDCGYGYKVFHKQLHSSCPIYHGPFFGGPYVLNEAYYSPIANYIDIPYQIGFHLFLIEADARLYVEYLNPKVTNFVICKVQYESIRAVGYQVGKFCIVTSKMTIVEELQ